MKPLLRSFFGNVRVFLATALAVWPGVAMFAAANAAGPSIDVMQGSDGNAYGTTRTGGTYGSGTFYRVTPAGATTVLYNFTGGSDGGAPNDALVAGSDGNFYGTTGMGGSNGGGTAFQVTASGALTTLFGLGGSGTSTVAGLVRGSDAHYHGTSNVGGGATIFALLSHPAYFDGQSALGSGVYYLAFANKSIFGYYEYLSDPNYIYHFDMGFEYVFDAADGHSGVYFYDFASNTFFYTSPTFSFPYLYDFTLKAFLYYYPDPTNPQRYNTNGVRYFYNFSTGQIISK